MEEFINVDSVVKTKTAMLFGQSNIWMKVKAFLYPRFGMTFNKFMLIHEHIKVEIKRM